MISTSSFLSRFLGKKYKDCHARFVITNPMCEEDGIFACLYRCNLCSISAIHKIN